MSEDVSPKKKQRYAEEFKNEARKRVRNGESEDKVARELDIHRSTIWKWMHKDQGESSKFELGKDTTDLIEKRFDLPVNKIEHQTAELDNTYASPICSFYNLEKERVKFSVGQQRSKEEQIRNRANSQEKIDGNNGNLQTTAIPDCPEMKSDHRMLYHGAEKQSQKEYNVPIVASNNTPKITDPSNSTPHSLERKKYSIELQQLAVLRVRTGDKIATVSKDMEIPQSTIRNWLTKNNSVTSDGASVFPAGDIQKTKEQKKSFDEKPGLSSETNSIPETSVTLNANLTEKPAKKVDSIGEQRTGYTPEVKRNAHKRWKEGKTITSISKDFRIPTSTIWEWTRKEKMKENAQQDDCGPSLKWNKWQEIMSSKKPGKGWAKRDIGYRLEKLSQHFEDRYGLFQLAVCKPTEKSVQADNIVYVKDGKILTLIERHCKYGFQKSSLINDKLKHDCSIKARCCYLTGQEKAAQEKTKLLQRQDYAWNKPCRNDVGDDRLSGDWSDWLLVMSPKDIRDDWIKRDGKQVGYKRKQLGKWFKDEFGIFEIAINHPDTFDNSVVFLACGKVLTAVERYCSDGSSAKSEQVNDVLNQGFGILVRYCYAKSGTEEEARKLELQLMIRYDYKWHKQRTKREDIKDEQIMYKWTDWKLIMAPVNQKGFVKRNDGNVGFGCNSIEAFFEDRFGVFELQISRGDCKEVTNVQHGNILILLQRYCIDGYKRSGKINRALDEGYSIYVRHLYVNSDNGKEIATTVLRQLLAIYDYAWNKTRREHIDDGDIAGDWSDWVTVMTSQIRKGWLQRNSEDASKGYERENFTELFEERYGNFEMQVEYHPHFETSGIAGEEVHDRNGKMETVVYLGKGNILTEVRTRCCNITKQSVLIDQALKDGKNISVRYCYTENDTIDEAAELERQLLDRYDYPWIRSKREDVDDNDLPGEWSEWSKIMKPGEVEKGWEWRDEKYIGFKAQNLDDIFKDDYGVFELAIEKTCENTVVHVGQGKVLSELKKYCKISTDGSYNFYQISDALAKRCNILVRSRNVQSQKSATDVEQHLVERYEYPWNPLNMTKREEVDDSSVPGQNWSEWQLLMAPKNNGPGWKRRDSGQTGYRLTDYIVRGERGIYEWKISKDRRAIVVYTGKAEQLSQRFADYCKNGSHIEDKFNKALQYGYDVSVRMRIMPSSNIDDAENKLLDRYNYAWNKARNGKERDIFLPYFMEQN